MPVLERDTEKFLGFVALDDLLKERGRNLEEERTREPPLKLRFLSRAWPGHRRFREASVTLGRTMSKDGTRARRRVDQCARKLRRFTFVAGIR